MKTALMLGLLVFLTGCTTTKMADQQLLSPSEAIASFKALGYDDWAANPFIRTEALCGGEKIHIPFPEINVGLLSLRQSKLTLATSRKGICSATHIFLLKDVEDANRIVLAANSLGAKVKYLITVD